MASPGAQAATRTDPGRRDRQTDAGRIARRAIQGAVMRRMVSGLAALALAMSAGGAAAYAVDTDACLKRMKPDVAALSDCAVPKAKIRAQSNRTPDEIIDAVLGECQSHLDALRAVLHADPCDQNDAQTEQVVGGVLRGERQGLSEEIAKIRGAQ